MSQRDAKLAKAEPDSELDEHAYAVIGAAIAVHRVLGPGLLESVYEEAFCIELAHREIPFERQVPLTVGYRQRRVGEVKLDVLVGGRLIVELKSVDRLGPIHTAQLLSYLKVARLRLGLLVNFNVTELRQGIKRLINSP